MPTSQTPATTDTTAATGAKELTPKDVQQLLTKANKGDTQALGILCAVEGTPWYWEESGNMAYQAQESCLKAFLGPKALLTQEAQRRKCAALRRELAGESPTSLERLLVDRIVLCGLHLHYVEALYAQQLETFSLKQHEFYQRRLSLAQHRYLSAIRTLAQVRRLQVPPVQVNIAEQQLNVQALTPGD